MIDPSKTSPRKARFNQTVVSALAIGALVATGHLAHAAKNPAPDATVTAAQTAARAADIEAISNQAGQVAVTLNPKQAQNLASALVAEIIAKTTGTNVTPLNKQDEAAETAANIIQGFASNKAGKSVKNLGKAKKVVLGVIGGAISAANNITTEVARDIAGSVAITLLNNPAYAKANKKGKLQKKLLKAFATNAGATTGINEGFSGSVKYEDAKLPNLISVADPETDQRPA